VPPPPPSRNNYGNKATKHVFILSFTSDPSNQVYAQLTILTLKLLGLVDFACILVFVRYAVALLIDYASSRMVSGLIPRGIIGIFH
jgi:hypothetical protein